MPYFCNLCDSFSSPKILTLLSHIEKSLKNEPNFHVLCGIEGCSKTYKNYYSFRNHLIRKHGVTRKVIDKPDKTNDSESQEEEYDEPMIDNDAAEDEDENARRQNALYLLKFKEKGRVPQTVIHLFVENATQLVRNNVDLLKVNLARMLLASGIDEDNIEGIRNLFDTDDNLVQSPFLGIEKERQQYQYFKNTFNLVVSAFYYCRLACIGSLSISFLHI